ncbi:hypothetical protein [Bdellovibrio sp. GT3]|uniref:hypothetical protein n=1 Tax=Bdellovibrio sp. GT3 TaxID=3136282 RepID=UPI0030EFEF0D
MALNVLSQAGALNPGSDLWVVPQLGKSQWTGKLDWYLNFQLCKSSRHNSANVPVFLNEVIKETEMQKFYRPVANSAPMMIATESLLPNRWVVVVPWDDNLGSWCESISQVWSGLQQPTLRVFLPPGQSTGNFQQAWSKLQSFQDLTVVLD